jgi:hypothetical protein
LGIIFQWHYFLPALYHKEADCIICLHLILLFFYIKINQAQSASSANSFQEFSPQADPLLLPALRTPPEVRKLEALFYKQSLNLAVFQNSFEWQHPVSAERKKTAFGILYEESIQN